MFKMRFRINFPSDFKMMEMKLNHVLEFIKHEVPDLPEEFIQDLRVIYSELITNAIIHGNKLDPSKKVGLDIRINDNGITSIISDEGMGFDYTAIFNKKRDESPFDEHGRGLLLALGLADAVRWNEPGNEIILQKYVKAV